MKRWLMAAVLALAVATFFACMAVASAVQARRPLTTLGDLSELKAKNLPENSLVIAMIRLDRVHRVHTGESAVVLQSDDADVYLQLRPAQYAQLQRERQFTATGYVYSARVSDPGGGVAGPELVHSPGSVTPWAYVAYSSGLSLPFAIAGLMFLRVWRKRARLRPRPAKCLGRTTCATPSGASREGQHIVDQRIWAAMDRLR